MQFFVAFFSLRTIDPMAYQLLYMKPLEQLFDWEPTNFGNRYPRVTSGETLIHITSPIEQTERIRMAL